MLCAGNLSETCTGYMAEMTKEVGAYYVYNLYEDCPAGESSRLSDFKSRMAAHGRTMVTGALNDYVRCEF
jgi:hypothetical protein